MSNGGSISLEDILDHYEISLRQGDPVSIQIVFDHWCSVCETPDQRETAELLSEFMKMDLEYCWRNERSSVDEKLLIGTVETYGEDFLERVREAGLLASVLLEEFRVRHRWGDCPAVAMYEKRFPAETKSIYEELTRIENEQALESSIRELFVNPEEVAQEEFALADSPDSMQAQPRSPLSEFLHGVYPFSELPGDLRLELSSTAVERDFATDDLLMEQGSESDSLMVVIEGIAQVAIQHDDGSERELAQVGPHAVLGEIGLITRELRSATVRATTPMRVAEIKFQDYQALAGRFPTLNIMVSELIAQRVGTIALDIMYGKQLGGYRFRHRLGRGSMGIVYLAEEEESGTPVAVKMLRHDLVYDRQASKRFQREADVVRQLEHPNIIQIHKEFSAYNTMFLSMEYCPGCTLGTAIGTHAPFPVEDIRRIVGQLAAALHHAHTEGIIHRDLKPANVMLGTDGILKLADFGLARSVECLKMTVHGQLLGTPRYMPNELLAGGEADERADLYALGLIIWELVTGKPLFSAHDIVSLLRQQMMWQLPERSEIREDLPEDIYHIFQESLSQQVEERTLELKPLTTWAEAIDPVYCTGNEEEDPESLDSTASIKDPTHG